MKTNSKVTGKLEEYLKKIDYDGRLERGEYFSNKEFRQLILENLEEYFKGNQDIDFIIELGVELYSEVIVSTDEHDDPLMTSVCMLTDLALSKEPVSEEEKKETALSVFNLLKR